MLTLFYCGKARGHMALVHNNPRCAVEAAVLAGLYASETAKTAALVDRSRRGGTKRGEQIAAKAMRHDADIRRYFQQWAASDELQSGSDELKTGPSSSSYIHKKINADKAPKRRISRKTIERRLSALGLPWQRERQ